LDKKSGLIQFYNLISKLFSKVRNCYKGKLLEAYEKNYCRFNRKPF